MASAALGASATPRGPLVIVRNPAGASLRHFDVLVVGGGILGVCHALEAARRRLTVLLLERDDFGGATSWASQRLLHGGLRYVQSLDVQRHRESVRERRWFLTHFPDHTRPQPCVMPLYNRGLKRTSTLRAALWVNEVLRRGADHRAGPSQIPAGRILSVEETRRWCPQVDPAGLRGGALWFDGLLVTPQRVLIEILRWACHGGASALNYVDVTGISPAPRSGYEVQAVDRVADRPLTFRATCVINAAGSGAADFHSGGHRAGASPALSLAFGLVLDRPAPAAVVAVSPGQSGHPMYFLVPLQDKLLAGTCHLPCPSATVTAEPTVEQVETFLAALNSSLPGLDADRSSVLRTFSGLLPTDAHGSATPSTRPIRRFHPSSTPDNPFVSVWGVKYTTARSVAAGTMQMLMPGRRPEDIPQPAPVCGLNWSHWSAPSAASRGKVRDAIRRLQRDESVVSFHDLIYRRTDWGMVSRTTAEIEHEIAALIAD